MRRNIPADQAVLYGDGQCMANVQTSSDVGRGTWNDKSVPFLGRRAVFGLEETLSGPPVVPCRLDGDGIVACCHGLCHV